MNKYLTSLFIALILTLPLSGCYSEEQVNESYNTGYERGYYEGYNKDTRG